MARTPLLLGIDLGTSRCKAALVRPDGSLAGTAASAIPTLHPAPGWAEQNPEDWMSAVANAVRPLWADSNARASDVAGLVLTSAAHIGVLLDARDAPLRPAILWNDQRSTAEVAALEAEAGAEILARTCQAVSTSWTLPHLVWVQRNEPDTWRKVSRVALSKDCVAFRLTGHMVTDPATAVSALLLDVGSGTWSPSLCALAGLRTDQLPAIRPVRSVAGQLTAAAAAHLGLSSGLPVVNGTLDSATEQLAAGIVSPGAELIRLATAGGIQRVVDGPAPDRRRITYPHAVEPVWYCQAGTNTCGAAVDWAATAFTAPGTGADIRQWDAVAAEAPDGSGGVLFHPYLAGERAPHWDGKLRGSFIGLGLHHDRAHMARAVYEGTAYAIRDAMTALPPAAGGEIAPPPAVVGGGTRSALWAEILAHVLNRPLRVVSDADSAYGAALLGLGVLCGTDHDLSAILDQRSTVGRVRIPDPQRVEVYRLGYEAYATVHRLLAPFYTERATGTSCGSEDSPEKEGVRQCDG